MNFKNYYNFQEFRRLANSNLPSPSFNYIDGAADDEVTYRRNTSAFDDVSLIPNVLQGVKEVDISTTIFGFTVVRRLVDEKYEMYYMKTTT